MGLLKKITKSVGKIAKQAMSAMPLHYADRALDGGLSNIIDAYSGQAGDNKKEYLLSKVAAKQNAAIAENEKQKRLKAFQYLAPQNPGYGGGNAFNPFKTLLGQ
jgi:hypothetical protein